MNDLGMMIVAASIRAAILAILGAIAYAIARRRSPAEGAFAAVTTLTLLTITVALAPSPWPRWEWAQPEPPAANAPGQPDEPATQAPEAVDDAAIANRDKLPPPRDDQPRGAPSSPTPSPRRFASPAPIPEARGDGPRGSRWPTSRPLSS